MGDNGFSKSTSILNIIKLRLTDSVKRELALHALSEYPNECCGIIACSTDGDLEAIRMENVENSSVSFRFDPHEHLRVVKEIANSGRNIAAFYHSHPHTAPVPSLKDIAFALGNPQEVHVIISATIPYLGAIYAFQTCDGGTIEGVLVD